MESLHIMWIVIVGLICTCIVLCNWLWYRNDTPNENTNYTHNNEYDPDAMP